MKHDNYVDKTQHTKSCIVHNAISLSLLYCDLNRSLTTEKHAIYERGLRAGKGGGLKGSDQQCMVVELRLQ